VRSQTEFWNEEEAATERRGYSAGGVTLT